jgi:predicted GNAT family N-acyltransferase
MSESVLKIQKLQGSSNWELWAIRMEAVLTEKGYYDVMTPTDYMETDDHSPEQQAAHIERQSRGKKAIAYIRLALSDGPLL